MTKPTQAPRTPARPGPRQLSRRAFMQLAAASGAAAGIASLLGNLRSSRAEDSAPVRRLLVLSHAHGWTYDDWKMRPSGLGEDAPWSADLKAMPASAFSPALAPLHAHRARMVAIDGLSLVSAELDGDGNRHDRGYIAAWTGHNANFASSTPRSQAPSIDQLVAAKIARADRLPSIELSVEAGLETGRPLAFAANGIRLPVANSPTELWQRVFGGAMDGGGLRSAKPSIDYAYAEYTALAPQLSAADHARLEAHFALVHDIGARSEGMAKLSCALPNQPAEALASYDERFDAFATLVTAAFACDATRVATFSLGEMPPSAFGAADLSDKVHKDIAHFIYEDPIKYAAMTNYFAHHSAQIATLLDRLEATPDPAGGSLLDHTLIIWGSELGDPWHGYRWYNPVLFGGSWAWPTGRYLYRPHQTPVELAVPGSMEPSGRTQFSGAPHQPLLVSVGRAMGLDIDHVGLDHVRGQRGDFVDCSGPLPGLVV